MKRLLVKSLEAALEWVLLLILIIEWMAVRGCWGMSAPSCLQGVVFCYTRSVPQPPCSSSLPPE